MELQPGLRIGLGSRFHSDLPWQERLRLNSGTATDGAERFARPDWRPATSAELAILLAGSGQGSWERDCCLLRFPEHLRRLWWDRAAEELLTQMGELSGYETFLREVAAFARFKGVPLLPASRYDILARPPGQRSPLGKDTDPARLIALVNLGDEPTGMVLWNRPVDLAPMDYPLVRVLLQPGDGCWLPAGCGAWPACTTDKADLDVLLLIRDAAGARKRQVCEEARTGT